MRYSCRSGQESVLNDKRIIILGSTGSIGKQALDVLADQPHLTPAGLAARSNWPLVAEQARQFGLTRLAMSDPAAAEALRNELGPNVTVFGGPGAMVELVETTEAEMVLSGVVGSCGLAAALAAIEAGRDLAIANKETLVMAGALVTARAAERGVRLLPVDSEHSAIHQCLCCRGVADVRRVIITASGGPFRDWPAERIADATVEQALNHPTWSMGPKITIDSATMMNKALEIIEAHWLFHLTPEQIDVVVHPESIVHSLVEYCDGSVLAQMGWPDMTTPIAIALNWPDRVERQTQWLDLARAAKLTFEPADRQRFGAIDLAYRVMNEGCGAGAVLNGANEAAVAAFLDGRIRFGRITELVEETLNRHAGCDESDLDALLEADRWARQEVRQALGLPAGNS